MLGEHALLTFGGPPQSWEGIFDLMGRNCRKGEEGRNEATTVCLQTEAKSEREQRKEGQSSKTKDGAREEAEVGPIRWARLPLKLMNVKGEREGKKGQPKPKKRMDYIQMAVKKSGHSSKEKEMLGGRHGGRKLVPKHRRQVQVKGWGKVIEG